MHLCRLKIRKHWHGPKKVMFPSINEDINLVTTTSNTNTMQLMKNTFQARFRRQTLHVLNWIPIWIDLNNNIRQLLQMSNLVNLNLIEKVNMTILQSAVIAYPYGGKMRERQIVEVKRFLQMRWRRIEEGDSRCI